MEFPRSTVRNRSAFDQLHGKMFCLSRSTTIYSKIFVLFMVCLMAMQNIYTINHVSRDLSTVLAVMTAISTAQVDPLRNFSKETNESLKYYASLQEMNERIYRFPTVKERVKVYMSTWYLPPCSDSDKIQYARPTATDSPDSNTTAANGVILMVQPHGNSTFLVVNTAIAYDRLFVYHSLVVEHSRNAYCLDFMKYIWPSLDRIHGSESAVANIPILLQIGDSEKSLALSSTPNFRRQGVDFQLNPPIPSISKFRFVMTKEDLNRVTTGECYDQKSPASSSIRFTGTVREPTPRAQPIVSIISNYERHFGPSRNVAEADIKWDQKLDMAVYRGALTGTDKGINGPSEEVAFCQNVPRCNLVYRHGNSSYVDAKLVPQGSREGQLSAVVNGVAMFGESMSMSELLRYKAIIMIEGNDVSSGFKWALFSNSVVLTQLPTCSSWAMEELLEPWVHFIPIADDFHDMEEKVQWILNHDEEAQQIARNGHLWIADLVYHPLSKMENEDVIDETLRRYQAHFLHNPSLLEVAPISLFR
jgi:Glycosyl transferase family 90